MSTRSEGVQQFGFLLVITKTEDKEDKARLQL